jgi:hypothetical protein
MDLVYKLYLKIINFITLITKQRLIFTRIASLVLYVINFNV